QAGYVGADSFAYHLMAGMQFSNTATVSIDVFNTAPVGDAPGYFTHSGTTLTVSSPGLLGNASDDDSDNLSLQLVQGPSHSTSFSLLQDGSFNYQPHPNFAGTDSFTFRIFDGAVYSDIVTVPISVENQAPVGNDEEYFTAASNMMPMSCGGQVLANDYDPDGDPLTAQLVSGPAPGATGMFMFSPSGAFTFTPAMNFVGTTTFTYQASDGVTVSDLVTVTIHVVNGVVAQDDYYILDGDNPVVVDASHSVLNNDFDVN